LVVIDFQFTKFTEYDSVRHFESRAEAFRNDLKFSLLMISELFQRLMLVIWECEMLRVWVSICVQSSPEII
jgi:hypothetical protein